MWKETMSAMPAEGSQSPAELADLGDVPTPPVTKAKTPEEPTPPRLHTPSNDQGGSRPGGNNHYVESSNPRAGFSEHLPAPPVSDSCQGTAHFYRRTSDRLPPASSQPTSHPETQQSSRVNGVTSTSASDPQHGRCHCPPEDWAVASTSAESRYHDEWPAVNGYRRSESLHNGMGPGDDMENYFNANAHMLAYLDLQEGEDTGHGGGSRRKTPPPEERQRSSSEGNHDIRSLLGCRNGYGSDDGIVLNGSLSGSRSQEGLSFAGRVKLSTSSEEQGDFIETDISLPPPDSGDNSMRSSSDEDLQLTAINLRERRERSHSAGSHSARRPQEGPKLLPPPGVSPHPSTVCDYKSGSSEANRPASFGVANRLCTCSVVSYSRRRPLAPSNQSSSDLDADEGVGGMKASPIEPSPNESDGGVPCGITVTSDSSSYFSPEDVDFMDFDMGTPSDNVGELVMGANIPHPEGELSQSQHGEYRNGTVHPSSSQSSRGDTCDECGKLEQQCLCASLRACKRLLEGANAQQHATSEQVLADGSSNRKRLCNVNSRVDNVHGCECCTEAAGRDSGSGSQEHLDALSYDEQDEDDALAHDPLPLPQRACACDYQEQNTCPCRVCNPQTHGPDALCEDTNNLDVEDFSAAPSSDYEDELFNVSRQTSTSNFDQDENAYQDAVEDCASNGFHSACSGSDLESEKSNHVSNQPEDVTGYAERPSPRPPEIPLPIPARGQDHAPRLPPSLPPASPAAHPVNGCPDCGGAERPPWMLEGARSISPRRPTHWADYELPSDRADPALGRHRVPAWMRPGEDDSPISPVRSLEQELLSAQGDGSLRYIGVAINQSHSGDRNVTSPGVTAEGGASGQDEESEPTFPDPLPDIFILNLLREKESRALYGPSQSRPTVDKVMIWNEYEAYVLQVKQIGASACGATAVINVLKAFNVYVDKMVVSEAIKTNRRAEKAPVADYLLSRSVAGCTAQHLMEGIETVTGGEITGRFFCFYPDRDVDICHWLGQWMKKGVVAVLTLNLQRAVPQGWDVPDAWHHQMAYGVGPKGVYLTNPLEIVPEEVIREQLTSDSELLVTRQDVIARWTADTDLSSLLQQPDLRWRQFNVLGQVVNVLREARRPRVLGFRPQLTPHVRIPAWYQPGISLFVRRHSDVFHELQNAPQLPLKAKAADPCLPKAQEVSPCPPRASEVSPCPARPNLEAEEVVDPTPDTSGHPPRPPLPAPDDVDPLLEESAGESSGGSSPR